MRCRRLPMGLVVMILASCGGEGPTPTPEEAPRLWVDSGGRSIPLDHREDARLILDDIVAVLRDLWEGIGKSGSVEFQVCGIRILDISFAREVGEGDGTTISIQGEAKVDLRSTPYRIFKGRDGASGVEEAVEEPTGPKLSSGADAGWPLIEEDIRERMFPEGLIEHMFLQDRER